MNRSRPEPDRARTIFNSYQGLLLETAQAQDEADGQKETATTTMRQKMPIPRSRRHCRFPGVEFILVLKPGAEKKFEVPRPRKSRSPWPIGRGSTLEQFRSLGDRLRAGPFLGIGRPRPAAARRAGAVRDNAIFCVGWQHSLSARQIQESMKKLLALWVS